MRDGIQGDSEVRYIRRLIATAVLTSIGFLVTSVAIAQPGSTLAQAEIPIEKLKSTYLRCENAAVNAKLGTGEIMLCSVVYEELKQRAFGGDFNRLKDWADQRLRPADVELGASR
jgi:hypothetical protein